MQNVFNITRQNIQLLLNLQILQTNTANSLRGVYLLHDLFSCLEFHCFHLVNQGLFFFGGLAVWMDLKYAPVAAAKGIKQLIHVNYYKSHYYAYYYGIPGRKIENADTV